MVSCEDATQVTARTIGCFFLTDALASQTGSAFWEESIETVEFRATFTFDISGGNGADGMGCYGMSGYAVEQRA